MCKSNCPETQIAKIVKIMNSKKKPKKLKQKQMFFAAGTKQKKVNKNKKK